MKNKKFLMSSISDKFHSVWGSHSHHHSKDREDCLIEEGGGNFDDHHLRAIVVYNNNAHTYEALQNPSEAQVVDEQDQEDGYDVEDYPDLTHTLFDSEGLDFGGSVIDKVKNCKEEAGKEFKLEDDIDEVADLYIRRFRRNIILQKQDSLKRKREIAQKGIAVIRFLVILLVQYLRDCMNQISKQNKVSDEYPTAMQFVFAYKISLDVKNKGQ
ncbi:hypothetical protein L195_g023803, partial [Trifolium pratense]